MYIYIVEAQVMHPELALFPSGDRHLCTFRRRKRSDEVTGYISGNGKYWKRRNRILIPSRWKFIDAGSFELARPWLIRGCSRLTFLSPHKRVHLALNPPPYQEYRGSNAAILNDPGTLMPVMPQREFEKLSGRQIFRVRNFTNLVSQWFKLSSHFFHHVT